MGRDCARATPLAGRREQTQEYIAQAAAANTQREYRAPKVELTVITPTIAAIGRVMVIICTCYATAAVSVSPSIDGLRLRDADSEMACETLGQPGRGARLGQAPP